MKKLALALVCLVSIAFFASCDPTIENPEPSISVNQTEGYLMDNSIADFDVSYLFGFNVASNPETGKALKSLVVTVDDELFDEVELDGDTYEYIEGILWPSSKEIIGTSTIKGVVTDVAGETNSVSFTVSLNYEEPLTVNDVTWVRKGSDTQGNTSAEMENCGLQWTGSYKDIMATIKPISGYNLYVVKDALEKYNSIVNVIDKEKFFNELSETARPVEAYREITTNNSADYNDILAVINEEGESHLVLIGSVEIQNLGTQGTLITISGKTK